MRNTILEEVEYTWFNGDFSKGSERIVREISLNIRIDGEHFVTAMITASMEKEFVIGHLFSQGIINNPDDIKSVTINENIAEVCLKENKQPSNIDSSVKSSLKVSKKDVFNCVRAILKSEIYFETEAVHSAGLFLEGKSTVSITEDLGRHNALDKVIGFGLLHGIDFSMTLAASTGRQPSEMIYKCLKAGIPIIASKGVPTSLAIKIAKRAGITIIGLVRDDTMRVYSNPSRIVWKE